MISPSRSVRPGEFWGRDISNAVSSKESLDIYCVYHGYEGDHRAPYHMTIGYRVPEDFSNPAIFPLSRFPRKQLRDLKRLVLCQRL